jgi:hypothetical protein
VPMIFRCAPTPVIFCAYPPMTTAIDGPRPRGAALDGQTPLGACPALGPTPCGRAAQDSCAITARATAAAVDVPRAGWAAGSKVATPLQRAHRASRRTAPAGACASPPPALPGGGQPARHRWDVHQFDGVSTLRAWPLAGLCRPAARRIQKPRLSIRTARLDPRGRRRRAAVLTSRRSPPSGTSGSGDPPRRAPAPSSCSRTSVPPAGARRSVPREHRVDALAFGEGGVYARSAAPLAAVRSTKWPPRLRAGPPGARDRRVSGCATTTRRPLPPRLASARGAGGPAIVEPMRLPVRVHFCDWGQATASAVHTTSG